MLFSDFPTIFRMLVVGTISYGLVVFVLRVSGKRSLSKMNSYDFIVTVALGSILATILTDSNLPLVDGVLAFSLLLFLQFISSWLAVRSDFFNSLIKSTPALLYYKGRFDEMMMKKERIPKNEILSAVRSAGFASLEDVLAVVLETDGTFSIIKSNDTGNENLSSLENVKMEKDNL